jgi:hypothetical protein
LTDCFIDGLKREKSRAVSRDTNFLADKDITMAHNFKNDDGTVNMDGLKGHLDFVKG